MNQQNDLIENKERS